MFFTTLLFVILASCAFSLFNAADIDENNEVTSSLKQFVLNNVDNNNLKTFLRKAQNHVLKQNLGPLLYYNGIPYREFYDEGGTFTMNLKYEWRFFVTTDNCWLYMRDGYSHDYTPSPNYATALKLVVLFPDTNVTPEQHFSIVTADFLYVLGIFSSTNVYGPTLNVGWDYLSGWTGWESNYNLNAETWKSAHAINPDTGRPYRDFRWFARYREQYWQSIPADASPRLTYGITFESALQLSPYDVLSVTRDLDYTGPWESRYCFTTAGKGNVAVDSDKSIFYVRFTKDGWGSDQFVYTGG
jgi:hypothetical protein